MRRKGIILIGLIYAASVLVNTGLIVARADTKENLAALCLSTQFPAASFSRETVSKEEKEPEEEKKEDENKLEEGSGKPRVLIYHTHATESYLPSSKGNYHTTEEKNTVRQVGEILKSSLESKGIGVIHDKTIHDNPSYDGSYDRSFNAISAILKKYPTIECVVDLHRDATAASTKGPIVKVNGENCAVYSYVLSNSTSTYKANKGFIAKLNQIAEKDFDDFTGETLERPYWYNQNISQKSLLLEMGNNRNNIEEVVRSAKVYGEILARALS